MSRLKEALQERKYLIERELGRGSMGRVYLAKDLRHDRSVAVKLLEPSITTGTGGARFLREIQITAGLQHPHILPLLDSGEAGDLVYYVMPHVEGEPLRAHLEKHKQLAVDEAVRIAGQVASALDYAHEQGVIHRDVKPDNVLLSAGMAMVADFGIARALSSRKEPHATSAGLALGTPVYMSPEQAAGDAVDHRTDIYSLGVMLYEMVVGRPPLVGPSVSATIRMKLTEPMPLMASARPGLPAALDGIVQKATARDPGQRYQTAKELGDALAPLLARESLVGTPHDSPQLQLGSSSAPGKSSGSGGGNRLHRLMVWGGVAAVVVIVGLALTPPARTQGKKGDPGVRTDSIGSDDRVDANWGRRPVSGTVGAVALSAQDADSVTRYVARGLWEAVNDRIGGRLTLLDSATAGNRGDDMVVVGALGHDGEDLVARFDWTSGADRKLFWSETYHFPPGDPGKIRAAIVDNLVNALASDSTR